MTRYRLVLLCALATLLPSACDGPAPALHDFTVEYQSNMWNSDAP